jgi:ribosomal protein S18 acetylase RimI-like enzyme
MLDAAISTYRERILELLGLSVFGDRSKIIAEFQQYEGDPNRLLTGIVHHEELVGLAGLLKLNSDQAILLHLAILPRHQRQGLGTKLIDRLMTAHNISILEAETDKEAVDFYSKLGFQIISLGEKYPGVERFRCTLSGGIKRGDGDVR